MHICYLAHSSSSHTRKWTSYMLGRGYRVTVLSLTDAPVECSRFVHLRSALGKMAGLPFLVERARREIAADPPDILHAHYSRSNGLIGALTGFHPFVLSVWGTDIYQVPRQSPWWRAATKYVCAKADHVCATSENLASETRRYCPDKQIVITPFGIDCARFSPAPNAGAHEFVFGTVKSLDYRYGVDTLIRAFAVASREWRWPTAPRLLIVGRGPHESGLRRLAKEAAVPHAIEFRGYVEHCRVPEVLREMDVFISVSVVNESFGVSALEASACGLPVIASRVPGFVETVQDNLTGIIVAPGDVAETAAAMLRLAADDGLRHSYGAAGRRWVEARYDWRHNAVIMEDLYARILRSCALSC